MGQGQSDIRARGDRQDLKRWCVDEAGGPGWVQCHREGLQPLLGQELCGQRKRGDTQLGAPEAAQMLWGRGYTTLGTLLHLLAQVEAEPQCQEDKTQHGAISTLLWVVSGSTAGGPQGSGPPKTSQRHPKPLQAPSQSPPAPLETLKSPPKLFLASPGPTKAPPVPLRIP